MAVKRYTSKKYRGIRWRESSKRNFRGKPDRCYEFVCRIGGRNKTVNVGWASEGVTEKYAAEKRSDYLHGIRHGDTPLEHKDKLLDEVFDSYRDWLKAEGKYYATEVSRYNKHLRPAFGNYTLKAITPNDLVALKQKLSKELSGQTVHHAFKLLSRIINHGIKAGLWKGPNIVSSRKSHFEMPKVQNDGERFFSPEEARLILDTLRSRHPLLHDMSLLSLHTGLRSTEIMPLTLHDFDIQNKTINITGKGGNREKVFMSPEMEKLYHDYSSIREPHEYLFQKPNRPGQKLDYVPQAFMRILNDLNINTQETPKRKKAWFHTWRHTFASWLAQSGKVDLYQLKELMRHKDIRRTLRYAHLIPGFQKEKTPIIGEVLKSSMPSGNHESKLLVFPSIPRNR